MKAKAASLVPAGGAILTCPSGEVCEWGCTETCVMALTADRRAAITKAKRDAKRDVTARTAEQREQFRRAHPSATGTDKAIDSVMDIEAMFGRA